MWFSATCESKKSTALRRGGGMWLKRRQNSFNFVAVGKLLEKELAVVQW